ncbi:MAG: hypothetical protein IT204_10835 [Fimbriimonadaceae bacterium]|nr:hypothetical protein [Fimbriimonadaceae bacterium]
MGKRLTVTLGSESLSLTLNDSATAAALVAAGPFEATAHRWGQELYFPAPADGATAEATADLVPLGTVGWWPPGRAVCLFFGPTPLSEGDEIRPASPVAVVGTFETDSAVLALLEDTPDQTTVIVRAAEQGE